MKLPGILKQIAARIDKEGGVPILVGGAVRDYLLGTENKDIDVEVFGLYYNQLVSILKKFGKVSAVGKAFGVLKLSSQGLHFDFSLPRNDVKTGQGHKGFRIKTDPRMSFRNASYRRDFTINALGYNLTTGEILDEFDGRNDLRNRILRVVDPQTFAEDPLRVLRGIQFAARFKLRIPAETKEVFKELIDSLDELPRERVYTEISKLLLKAKKPSIGLKLADEIGINKKLFPELNALNSLPKESEWEEEGSLWEHTLRTVDAASQVRTGERMHDLTLMFAALTLQLVKLNPDEFIQRKKFICGSQGNYAPSVCKHFLCRITNEVKLVDMVDATVNEQKTLEYLFRSSQVKNGDIRRLSLRVDIPLLVKLSEVHFYSQFTPKNRPSSYPAGEWLMKKYHTLKLESRDNIQPILLGRHLISLGLKPGPFFGKILNDAYQKQLDDEFLTLDEAIHWAENQIADIQS